MSHPEKTIAQMQEHINALRNEVSALQDVNDDLKAKNEIWQNKAKTNYDAAAILRFDLNKAMTKLSLNENEGVLLKAYSEWLEEHGFMDSDWWSELPSSITRFLKDRK